VNDDPVLIGLDCSTHGAKAIAWTKAGLAVAQASAPFALSNPKPGWWEQEAGDWISAAVEALSQVARDVGSRVVGIGITHQRETFVGVDRHLTPVRPAIVWMDERARDDVIALREAVGEERFHETTGKPLSVTPSVTKIRWLRRTEPDAFRRVHRWLDVQGFLLAHLAGKDVTSVGSAGPMGLVDLRSGDWSEMVLDAVGVAREQLPGLVPSGSIVGGLSEPMATRTGLRSGTPVVATAGDGQVAALGAGVVDLTRAYLNLGTAIVAGTVAGEFQVDRAFRTMAGAYPGTFLLESDLKGGTFTLDWLRERVLGGVASLEVLESEAGAIPVGSEGLLLLPYLATVMDPYWDDDASGVLLGLRGHHGPAHLYRSVLEGIALEERLHMSCIERAANCHLGEFRVLGGGANSDLWCQVLADVLDRPMVRTRSPEATSLGAAMLAAVATGVSASVSDAVTSMCGTDRTFQPGPNRDRYRTLYEQVYVDLYPTLRTALGRLARWTREDGTTARR